MMKTNRNGSTMRSALLMGMATVALLAFAARPAYALWRTTQLTTNGIYDEQQFTVKTKDVDNLIQFEVSITPHPHAVSPFLNGQLSLIVQDKWVASVYIMERRKKDTVTYTFRVAPDAIAQSTLEIHASFYAPARNVKSPFSTAMLNNQKVEQSMGGTIYQMKLKDFSVSNTRTSGVR